MSLVVALYAIRVRSLGIVCDYINSFDASAIGQVGSRRSVHLWLASGRDPCSLGEWRLPPCSVLLGIVGGPGTFLLRTG